MNTALSLPDSSQKIQLTSTEESDIYKKLQEAAKSGNIEAIRTLRDLQLTNRYNELVNNMDDDEFNP